MKKFMLSLGAFVLPLLVIAGVICYVDPYNLFFLRERSGMEEYKMDNGWIQRMSDYNERHNANMIFGSSWTYCIDVNHIPQKNWGNLSLPGANLPEYLRAFWHTTKSGNLKKVIIFIDLYQYLFSLGGTGERFDSYQDLIEHPYKGFTSSLVLETVYNYLIGKRPRETDRDFETIWKSQIEIGKKMCTKVTNDRDQLNKSINSITDQLIAVKQYCDKHNIEIVLATPIISSELYQVYVNYAPELYQMVMIDLVSVFGKVIDFAYPNVYTNCRYYFNDPFHVKTDSIYVNSLWGEMRDSYQIIDNDNVDSVLESRIRK